MSNLKTAISNLFIRGVITAARYADGIQIAQVTLRANETRDDIERVEHAGFTSWPADDTEALCVSVGGELSHMLIIGETDANRPEVAKGDACLYAPADGLAMVQAQNGGKVAIGKSGVELLAEISDALGILISGTYGGSGAPGPLLAADKTALTAVQTKIDSITGSL